MIKCKYNTCLTLQYNFKIECYYLFEIIMKGGLRKKTVVEATLLYCTNKIPHGRIVDAMQCCLKILNSFSIKIWWQVSPVATYFQENKTDLCFFDTPPWWSCDRLHWASSRGCWFRLRFNRFGFMKICQISSYYFPILALMLDFNVKGFCINAIRKC